MAKILDGKALARKMQEQLGGRVAGFVAAGHRRPGLAVLMVGNNPASAAYVRNKERSCEKVGIASFGKHLPEDIDQVELESLIDELNVDERVDGILVQLPLPKHLNSVALLNRIHPDKDADGLHPMNLGRLLRGESGLRSCTPAGVMRLLKDYDIHLAGKNSVVIGRSILVGKPLAMMLLEQNATVTIAHSKTTDLGALARSADILIAAVGRPELVTPEMVKPGAVVIDVGINRVGDKLVGDVAFEPVQQVASWITPVPGGIGPMTVTLLLYNTVWSYEQKFSRGGQG